ncbi:MAG TPA: aldehyde dehydrogenase family protein, partial [Casimicrobiaceae bacterium]|nr:aldehyde dehydrogenase family protein [Casimicrobiaceae bacterium]
TRLLHEAGVPREVMACLVGAGEVGSALLAQQVDGVFFTGSVATGRKIAAAVAGRMVKLQLELGGKDPIYVCDDVDVAAAAAGVADGAFYNNGQSCCAVERIYVADAIYEPFVAAFVKEVKGFRMGDPLDEATYLGPLTRKAQIGVLKRQVAQARKLGGKVLTGGKAVEGRGHWFEATVVADAHHGMDLMREESFGPVIGLQRVASDDEAVALMNDTDYGLTAGVYTKSAKRARRILERVNAGSVYWNCCDRVSPRLPWSGLKHSGIGLTLSTYGIQTFTRPKAWHLREA